MPMEKISKKPSTLYGYLEWLYFYMCASVGLWMLESWERALFNIGILLILIMSGYTAYAYLPGQIHAMFSFFGILSGTQV